MKPSKEIEKILCSIMSRYANPNDVNWNNERVNAVIAYLDEQAQEPKALEEISPSEALYGFAGWLTSSDISLTIGAKHEAGEMAVLVDKFCKSQGLASPRDVYPNNLKPYPVAKQQDEPKDKKLCPMCIEGGSHRLPTGSTITGTWICFCPCHQKETEPKYCKYCRPKNGVHSIGCLNSQE